MQEKITDQEMAELRMLRLQVDNAQLRLTVAVQRIGLEHSMGTSDQLDFNSGAITRAPKPVAEPAPDPVESSPAEQSAETEKA